VATVSASRAVGWVIRDIRPAAVHHRSGWDTLPQPASAVKNYCSSMDSSFCGSDGNGRSRLGAALTLSTSPVRLDRTEREPMSFAHRLTLAADSGFPDMRRFTALPRPVLMTLAVLFAAASTLWSILWEIQIRQPIPDTGIVYGDYAPATLSIEVQEVEPSGPGERAGMRLHDRIVAINGRKLASVVPIYEEIMLGRVGDSVQFTVERPGATGQLQFHLVTEQYMARSLSTTPEAARFLRPMMMYYPFLFLTVSLAVLFLRLDDPHAWRLALLFSSFITGAPISARAIDPPFRGFMYGWEMLLTTLTPVLFFYFFATFPAPSPIDRKVPWLKHVFLGFGLAIAIPLGLSCLVAGGPLPLLRISGSWLREVVQWPGLVYALGAFALGFVSLIWNSIHPSSAEVRRKTRVIVWGAVLGIGPVFLLIIAAAAGRVKTYEFPFWAYALVVICLGTFLPLSFAYTVVKHRVLEIPVLVKRSARYLLVQRGFVILSFMVAMGLVLIFISILTRSFQANQKVALPAGIALGILFGATSVGAALQIHRRVSRRIDRACFAP